MNRDFLVRYALSLLLPVLAMLPACGGRGAVESTEQLISDQGAALRDLGFAQLENEAPEEAEKTYRELIEQVPEDPLGYANLAIALLRQQRQEEALVEIEKALAKAPGRSDLLAIQADILQWDGQADAALALYRQAAEKAPEDLEILYALYRLSVTQESEQAEEAAGWAVEKLTKLRPENVVVLLAQGQRAIAAEDRRAATSAFLRIRELLWQAPPLAEAAMELLLEALEGDVVAEARVPALRLENVLKVTAMYRESLRELVVGIQGIPVLDFAQATEAADFGAPGAVHFKAEPIAREAVAALTDCDLDADGRQDLIWLTSGESPAFIVRRSRAEEGTTTRRPAPLGAQSILCTDLDNDGFLDLLVLGARTSAYWRGDGSGSLVDTSTSWGLDKFGARAAEAFDFDIEGDLDLVLASGEAGGIELLYNDLEGPLEAVGEKVLPRLELDEASDVVASDLDRDGDLDLVIAHRGGIVWLDNLRQGRFADRSAAFAGAAPATAVISADLDNDGFPEVIAAGERLEVFHNTISRTTDFRNKSEGFEQLDFSAPAGPYRALAAFDADLDGRLDLVLGGERGATLLQQGADGEFTPLAIEASPARILAVATADLDEDGDLDLLLGGAEGLFEAINQGAEERNWIALRLRGLDKGNSKNNLFGRGSVVEVRSAGGYQLREAHGDVIHFGLGDMRRDYLVRIVWTNGVPQSRQQLTRNETVVEEQLLKGSCPFLYASDGEAMVFVTDLLWGAPLGMPLAPGVWAGADPEELVRVDGATAIDGRYHLSITEELWEAAYFDFLRLWVVDHPPAVEVASSLRIQPGQQIEDRVLGSRGLRPLAAAWNGRGEEVSEEVARRDGVYADGYRRSRYQGVAAEPWTFTLDLGEAPGKPIRLHLDGWIFPADASLNLALAQRSNPAPIPPRLEIEVDGEWLTLVESMGFPAGKTKTMVIDTPALPAGVKRLRIVTGQWLHWDRIVWTTEPTDSEPRIVAKLDAARAELRFRGFSGPTRAAPNAPHEYDYEAVTSRSPWLPFPGFYTRFGDVRPLLLEADDRSVILAPGDEIDLVFDAGRLAPPPAGWSRTVFLESHGWDKDADRNTWAAGGVEPLPFKAMSGYPYGPGEAFPDTPEMQRYRDEWLTREIKEESPGR